MLQQSVVITATERLLKFYPEDVFKDVSFALNIFTVLVWAQHNKKYQYNGCTQTYQKLYFVSRVFTIALLFISLNFLDVTTITVLCYLPASCACAYFAHIFDVWSAGWLSLYSIHWKRFTMQLKLQHDDIWY